MKLSTSKMATIVAVCVYRLHLNDFRTFQVSAVGAVVVSNKLLRIEPVMFHAAVCGGCAASCGPIGGSPACCSTALISALVIWTPFLIKLASAFATAAAVRFASLAAFDCALAMSSALGCFCAPAAGAPDVGGAPGPATTF